MYSKFKVAVEGSVGAGKSTVLKNILNELKKLLPTSSLYMLQEPVEWWQKYGSEGVNMLARSYEHASRWGFQFQILAMIAMVENYKKETGADINIYERLVNTSTEVFAKKFVVDGVLTNTEYEILKDLEHSMMSHPDLNEIDLVLYLKADVKIVKERIQARSRDEESSISLETLEQLDYLYDKHISHITEAEVVVIDANQSEQQVLMQCVNIILDRMRRNNSTFQPLSPSYTPKK